MGAGLLCQFIKDDSFRLDQQVFHDSVLLLEKNFQHDVFEIAAADLQKLRFTAKLRRRW